MWVTVENTNGRPTDVVMHSTEDLADAYVESKSQTMIRPSIVKMAALVSPDDDWSPKEGDIVSLNIGNELPFSLRVRITAGLLYDTVCTLARTGRMMIESESKQSCIPAIPQIAISASSHAVSILLAMMAREHEPDSKRQFDDAMDLLMKLRIRWIRALASAIADALADEKEGMWMRTMPVSAVIGLEAQRFLRNGAVPNDLDASIAGPDGQGEG